ncbi:MAG: alanyl-tRNA editing protein [Pseudomonadota bacterium]
MTKPLYAQDAYLKFAQGRVTARTDEGGLILDQTVFYPRGGGQPGDSGRLIWPGGQIEIATAVKVDGAIVLVPAEAAQLPQPGTQIDQHLDWNRRFGHMRVHTALHLLSVALPFPVTGGAIAADRGRLDFAMPELAEPKEVLEGRLNALITRDLRVGETWIAEEELDARPELVKTMSVAPPRGVGRIRLVQIGGDDTQIDLQPCGGTHVARTAEIGAIAITKVENKGRKNRRVTLSISAPQV